MSADGREATTRLPTSSRPTVSVIVPTYNRPAALARCLSALAEQNLSRAEFEVVVVDDGSEPPIERGLNRMGGDLDIRVLRQINQGPSAARNLGARYARGEVLAFTDDDCRPDPDWLTVLTNRLRRAPESVIGGSIQNGLPANRYTAVSQTIVELVYEHNGDSRQAWFFAANNLAMIKRTFDEIGGFDPNFRTAEDRDICDRLQLAGHELVFEPAAVVFHEHGLSFARFCRMYFRYGRGAFLFHRARTYRRPGRILNSVGFHCRMDFLYGYIHRNGGSSSRLFTALALAAWQISTLLGICWQAVLSGGAMCARWLDRSRPRQPFDSDAA